MFPKNLSRIVVCEKLVDFRKQWNGLLGEAERLGFDPYAGDLVVFVKRDRRQLRAICGDEKGFYLFSRRFEGGVFSFSFTEDGVKTMSRSCVESWFAGTQTISKTLRSVR